MSYYPPSYLKHTGSKKSILVAFYEYFMKKGRRQENEAYLVIIPASNVSFVFH